MWPLPGLRSWPRKSSQQESGKQREENFLYIRWRSVTGRFNMNHRRPEVVCLMTPDTEESKHSHKQQPQNPRITRSDATKCKKNVLDLRRDNKRERESQDWEFNFVYRLSSEEITAIFVDVIESALHICGRHQLRNCDVLTCIYACL